MPSKYIITTSPSGELIVTEREPTAAPATKVTVEPVKMEPEKPSHVVVNNSDITITYNHPKPAPEANNLASTNTRPHPHVEPHTVARKIEHHEEPKQVVKKEHKEEIKKESKHEVKNEVKVADKDDHKRTTTATSTVNDPSHKNISNPLRTDIPGLAEPDKGARKLIELGMEYINKIPPNQWERIRGSLEYLESCGQHHALKINIIKHRDKKGNVISTEEVHYSGLVQLGWKEQKNVGSEVSEQEFLNNKNLQQCANDRWLCLNIGTIINKGLDKHIGDIVYDHGKPICEVTIGGLLTAANLRGLAGVNSLVTKHLDPNHSTEKDKSDSNGTSGMQFLIAGALAQYTTKGYEDIKQTALHLKNHIRDPKHNVYNEILALTTPGQQKPTEEHLAQTHSIVDTLKRVMQFTYPTEANADKGNDPNKPWNPGSGRFH